MADDLVQQLVGEGFILVLLFITKMSSSIAGLTHEAWEQVMVLRLADESTIVKRRCDLVEE
jgi:hypothetical protein